MSGYVSLDVTDPTTGQTYTVQFWSSDGTVNGTLIPIASAQGGTFAGGNGTTTANGVVSDPAAESLLSNIAAILGGSIAVTGPLTSAQLTGAGLATASGQASALSVLTNVSEALTGPLTVTGAVSVANLPVTQTVNGSVVVSNFPATQAVSGSVSVSNLPATQNVAVTNFPTTQQVSGSVAVSSLPAGLATSAAQTIANQSLSTIANAVSGTLSVTVTNGAQTGSAIHEGSATVSTSAAALPAATLTQGAVLKASPNNQAAILIGGSGVTTSNGFPLYPGDTFSAPVNNLNLIYIVSASSTTDTILYFGV